MDTTATEGDGMIPLAVNGSRGEAPRRSNRLWIAVIEDSNGKHVDIAMGQDMKDAAYRNGYIGGFPEYLHFKRLRTVRQLTRAMEQSLD